MRNPNCPGEIDNDRMIRKSIFIPTLTWRRLIAAHYLSCLADRYCDGYLLLTVSVWVCGHVRELISTVFWLIANNWKSKIDNLFIQPQILEIGWMDKGRWLIMSEKIWLIGPPILCWRVMKKVNMNEVLTLFEQPGNFHQIRNQLSNQPVQKLPVSS